MFSIISKIKEGKTMKKIVLYILVFLILTFFLILYLSGDDSKIFKGSVYYKWSAENGVPEAEFKGGYGIDEPINEIDMNNHNDFTFTRNVSNTKKENTSTGNIISIQHNFVGTDESDGSATLLQLQNENDASGSAFIYKKDEDINGKNTPVPKFIIGLDGNTEIKVPDRSNYDPPIPQEESLESQALFTRRMLDEKYQPPWNNTSLQSVAYFAALEDYIPTKEGDPNYVPNEGWGWSHKDEDMSKVQTPIYIIGTQHFGNLIKPPPCVPQWEIFPFVNGNGIFSSSNITCDSYYYISEDDEKFSFEPDPLDLGNERLKQWFGGLTGVQTTASIGGKALRTPDSIPDGKLDYLREDSLLYMAPAKIFSVAGLMSSTTIGSSAMEKPAPYDPKNPDQYYTLNIDKLVGQIRVATSSINNVIDFAKGSYINLEQAIGSDIYLTIDPFMENAFVKADQKTYRDESVIGEFIGLRIMPPMINYTLEKQTPKPHLPGTDTQDSYALIKRAAGIFVGDFQENAQTSYEKYFRMTKRGLQMTFSLSKEEQESTIGNLDADMSGNSIVSLGSVYIGDDNKNDQLTIHQTRWKDWAVLSSVGYRDNDWSEDKDAFFTSDNQKKMYFNIPYETGTVISGFRLKFSTPNENNGIEIELLRRSENGTEISFETVASLEKYGPGTIIATYPPEGEAFSEIMKDNYSYCIRVSSLVNEPDGIWVYSTGLQTKKRVL